MKVVLLGVRGSTPAPGPAFVRYGGHTSCVAVLAEDGTPVLVLDAGTGLRDLGAVTGGAPFRGAVVLTHLHWDHVQGLPFCPVIDDPDAVVDLYLPAACGSSVAGLLARSMSPPHFPIGPEGLAGRWRFLAAPPSFAVGGGLLVTVAEIAHKGGRTLGVRVSDGTGSMAYLPDHAPQLGATAAARLADGVDLLLHDGQFLATERERADAYGHAVIPDALAFAERCRVGRLVLTHHAPGRTDDELDAVAATLPTDRPVHLARQNTAMIMQKSRR